GAMTSKAMDFARKASPAQAERLDAAFGDLEATIGKSFVPILEQTTDGVRLAGDVLASILPETGEMREALAPVKDVMTELRNAASDTARALRLIVGGMVKWPAVQVKIGAAITSFLIQVGRYLSPLAALGRAVGGGTPLRSSVGAAGGHASFTGLADLGNQAALSAFGAG